MNMKIGTKAEAGPALMTLVVIHLLIIVSSFLVQVILGIVLWLSGKMVTQEVLRFWLASKLLISAPYNETCVLTISLAKAKQSNLPYVHHRMTI
jgi:hypothetical protein